MYDEASRKSAEIQRAMYDDASRKRAAEINNFLEMLPTMRRSDLERLIAKRPALWGRFADYLTNGHVFVDDEPSNTRHHATKKSPAQLQREIDEALTGTLAQEKPPNNCKIPREERALLITIERGGSHGAVAMQGLNKAAKGIIAKGLGYSIGRTGGGHYIYSTVKGSACLGIDWDNGPRPPYDERKGEYVISANGTFQAG